LKGFELNFRLLFCSVALSVICASCAFLPETSENQEYYSKCKMSTKKLVLKADIDKKYSVCDASELKDTPLVCLVANGIVSSASIIISGSIVVLGNSIHWLEYKAGCKPNNKKDSK
jgi:hypothetical protein